MFGPKQWRVHIQNTQKTFQFQFDYHPKTQDFTTWIRLKNLPLNPWVSGLKGEVSGYFEGSQIQGKQSFFAQDLRIDHGFYKTQPLVFRTSFVQEDQVLRIPQGVLSLGSLHFEVHKAVYAYQAQANKPHYFTAEDMQVAYKTLDLVVQDLEYRLASLDLKGFNRFGSWSFWVLWLVRSQIAVRKVRLFWPEGGVVLSHLDYQWQKNWRLDLDLKVVLTFLNDRYQFFFEVFGGKEDARFGELIVKSDFLQVNQDSPKRMRLALRNIGKRWQIQSNPYFLKGYIAWLDEGLVYFLNYHGQTIFLSKGQVDFAQQTLDLRVALANYDLYASQLQWIAGEVVSIHGIVESDVSIQGSWKDPQIKGYFYLREGQLELMDRNFLLKDCYFELRFGKLWLEQNNTHYEHQFNAGFVYNESPIQLLGYFNLDRWQVGRYEVHLDVRSPLQVNGSNPTLKYTGDVSGSLYLKKDSLTSKTLSGTVWLGEGSLTYLGSATADPLTKGWFSDVQVQDLEVRVRNEIDIDLKPEGLSLGELKVLEKKEGLDLASQFRIQKKKQKWSVEGGLLIERGEFNYFGIPFRIVDGTLRLNPNRQTQVSLLAKTKLRDEKNKEVTIFLRLEDSMDQIVRKLFLKNSKGTQYFLNNIYSIPPKGTQELVLLLGLDYPVNIDYSDEQKRRYGAGRFLDMGLYLALIKPIEQKLKELFGIDTFNLHQKFFENSLHQEIASIQKDDLHQGSNIHIFRDTELILGKYLASDVYWNIGLLLSQDLWSQDVQKLQKVFKTGLEVDLLSLFAQPSDVWGLIFNSQYRHNADEIIPSRKNEGLLKLQADISF